jgi:hypothetical protein
MRFDFTAGVGAPAARIHFAGEERTPQARSELLFATHMNLLIKPQVKAEDGGDTAAPTSETARSFQACDLFRCLFLLLRLFKGVQWL